MTTKGTNNGGAANANANSAEAYHYYESGTSLAEQEFQDDADVNKANIISSDSGQSSVRESATKHHRNNNNSSSISIEALRSSIAQDVLSGSDDGTGGSCGLTTFTSPFGAPSSSSSSSSNNNNNNNNSRPSVPLELPLVYCDHTASNRPLRSVETYLRNRCLPLYGNTHTNTSLTGSQTTAFVAEARQIVAEATNAKITGKASQDVVLFAGSGATSTVELLIDCLGLQHYSSSDDGGRPVVFVGPFEHHSNLVPWRESGCEIVMVPESSTAPGTVDEDELIRLLQLPQYNNSTNNNNNRIKMGTFTAASNLTGRLCDTDRLTAILHRHGALAFFDYATAAPYVPINMNPAPPTPTPISSSTTETNNKNNNAATGSSSSSSSLSLSSLYAKDAVFVSPHKMLGGVGTPGVLIVKKHLVSQVNPPRRSGGGTVFYVTNNHHRFLSNRIERYEGGTPNIPGILRVGLVFLHKRQAEERYRRIAAAAAAAASSQPSKIPIPLTMQEYEHRTWNRVASHLRQHAPNLVLLGDTAGDDDGGGGPTLPIFSFLIRFGKRFLHFNYVCAVLNDVFGIQSRGGCQCAGPYAQRLLGLTTTATTMLTTDNSQQQEEVPNERNRQVEHALMHYKERAELLRPGFTRLSLPFKGVRPEEDEYVLKALVWVSKHAWALMCQYRCNHRTGEWRHFSRQGKPLGRSERRWLSHFDISAASSAPSQVRNGTANGNKSWSPGGRGERDLASFLDETLANADRLLVAAKNDQVSIAQALKMTNATMLLGDNDGEDQLERLRWYVYPQECASVLAESVSGSEGAEMMELAESEPLLGALAPIKQNSNRSISTSKAPGTVPTAPSATSADVLPTDRKHKPARKMDETDNQGSELGMTSDTNNKTVLDVKRMKKKPHRDSSTWGQGSAPTSTAPVVSHSKQIEENMLVSSHAAESGEPSKAKKKRFLHTTPPAKMMRLITQAIIQWDMIQEGDRLLLGLSGGKDSLSLLHCLMEFHRRTRIKFEIEVCTVDPMTPSFDPSPLIPYVESLGLKYHYIRDDIVNRASTSGKEGDVVKSMCAFCARMKRGNLYTCARRNNCNKLVLAQHLDDCAESFMMSVMHNGFLRTMKANYIVNAGDVSVIRPMVYCRESLMTEFAKSAGMPIINENCPACFEEPKERARIKKMLSREETLFPNFYDNIKRSLIPLMHDDSTAIMRCYTEEVVSRTCKVKDRKNRKRSKFLAAANQELQSSQSKTTGSPPETDPNLHLALRNASEEDLIKELARRKAERFRHSGAMKRLKNDESPSEKTINDPTGQVCTLNGGNGSIPCRELME